MEFESNCRNSREPDRLCGFELPGDSGNRPVFAPEI
jgi:hypothetical protein